MPERRLLLEPRGHGLRAVLAEELLRALGDRQQAHDALLRLDDAAFPLGKLDAERLREAAHHVEDQREALGLAAGGALFVVVLVGRLFVLALVACVLRRLAVRALERPEEQRREPRVLLDGAGRAVAGLGLGGAEHLGEGAAAHDLPDLLQVLGERDLAPVGGLDLRVAAEDLERRADAGEDEVGAAHAFALQALHPVADALRQLAQDVGPVADRRVVRARAADEMDAGGEARGISGAQPGTHFCRESATSRDDPAAADHPGKKRLPALGRLVREDDATDRRHRAAPAVPPRKHSAIVAQRKLDPSAGHRRVRLISRRTPARFGVNVGFDRTGSEMQGSMGVRL